MIRAFPRLGALLLRPFLPRSSPSAPISTPRAAAHGGSHPHHQALCRIAGQPRCCIRAGADPFTRFRCARSRAGDAPRIETTLSADASVTRSSEHAGPLKHRRPLLHSHFTVLGRLLGEAEFILVRPAAGSTNQVRLSRRGERLGPSWASEPVGGLRYPRRSVPLNQSGPSQSLPRSCPASGAKAHRPRRRGRWYAREVEQGAVGAVCRRTMHS